jgi:hypothetical protein
MSVLSDLSGFAAPGEIIYDRGGKCAPVFYESQANVAMFFKLLSLAASTKQNPVSTLSNMRTRLTSGHFCAITCLFALKIMQNSRI